MLPMNHVAVEAELDRREASRAKEDAKSAGDDQSGSKRKGGKHKTGGKVKGEDAVGDDDGEKDVPGDKDPAKWQMSHMTLAESSFLATSCLGFGSHDFLF